MCRRAYIRRASNPPTLGRVARCLVCILLCPSPVFLSPQEVKSRTNNGLAGSVPAMGPWSPWGPWGPWAYADTWAHGTMGPMWAHAPKDPHGPMVHMVPCAPCAPFDPCALCGPWPHCFFCFDPALFVSFWHISSNSMRTLSSKIAVEMQCQTAYTSIVEGRLIEKVMAYNSTHFDIHVTQRATPILIHVRIYLTCSHVM